MSKICMVLRNEKRKKMAEKYEAKRKALKAAVVDENLSSEERIAAMLKLAKLPRNSSKTRSQLRCFITGRARGNLRKFGMCRNKFRELASEGKIPGVTKASW